VIFLRPAYRVQFGTLVGCRFDRRLFGRLIWFGSPNGLHYLLEVGWFTVFILLVGRLGTLPLTATNLAFNVNALAFMPVLGIGMAVSTIVGQRLGQERPDLAARATVTAFWIGLAYMAAISSVYVLTPDLLLWGYASRADPESFRQLRDLTVILLRFVAAYCIFDTLAIVFVSAIKGAGDTQFVLRTMLVMSALPLVACYLVVEVFELGLFWAWGVVTVYVWVLGLIFLARFLQGRWRDMRVIESEFRPDELSEIVDPPLPATAEV
jgi:MATE family multidrug resistance protein